VLLALLVLLPLLLGTGTATARVRVTARAMARQPQQLGRPVLGEQVLGQLAQAEPARGLLLLRLLRVRGLGLPAAAAAGPAAAAAAAAAAASEAPKAAAAAAALLPTQCRPRHQAAEHEKGSTRAMKSAAHSMCRPHGERAFLLLHKHECMRRRNSAAHAFARACPMHRHQPADMLAATPALAPT
jgi:hypothetical protein